MFKKQSKSPLQTALNTAADAILPKQQKSSHKLRNGLIGAGVITAIIAAASQKKDEA